MLKKIQTCHIVFLVFLYVFLFPVYPYLHVHVGCGERIEICTSMPVSPPVSEITPPHHTHTHYQGDWQHAFQSRDRSFGHAAKAALAFSAFSQPLIRFAFMPWSADFCRDRKVYTLTFSRPPPFLSPQLYFVSR